MIKDLETFSSHFFFFDWIHCLEHCHLTITIGGLENRVKTDQMLETQVTMDNKLSFIMNTGVSCYLSKYMWLGQDNLLV